MSKTINGMPEIEIFFRGLGTSAIKRGERGSACLIVEDSTDDEAYVRYRDISDFTSTEQAKFTTENVGAIKDALEGVPRELYVFRIGEGKLIEDIFQLVAGTIPRNSWIGCFIKPDPEDEEGAVRSSQSTLSTWIKSQNKTSKKAYKGLTYALFSPDDKHVTNLTNPKVVFNDNRKEMDGVYAVPYCLGLLAGLPLTMSAIAKPFTKFKSVTEPENLEEAISNGEFVLFNDEGIVKCARGVNSMTTLTSGDTNEMTFINTVEKMDLTFTDIFTAWNNNYKGKYPNTLDNQMLLISAVKAYFSGLMKDEILDPNFENNIMIDIEKQKRANYPKYGEDIVKEWTDSKIMKMTVSTDVYLKAIVKYTGIMESFYLDIYM